MDDGEVASNTNYEAIVSAIDKEEDELASLRGSYMASCKGPRGRIREIKTDAKESGVKMRALNAYLKKHKADRAQERRVAELEPEDHEAYEDIVEKMGDYGSTPLGAAALDRAKGKSKRSGEGSLDSLHR